MSRARRLDWLLPLLPAALLLLALLAMLATDPANAFTASTSPFTDEGYNALNARNLVLLGTWATDDWNLHLVNLPFSVTLAGVFSVFGVGIIQARVVALLMTVASVAGVGLLATRRFGTAGGAVAALGLAANVVVLYYGRLVYLEQMVMLLLVLGTVALVARPRDGAIRMGLLAGIAYSGAVLTKPSAVFAVAGALIGVLLAGTIRDRRALSRLAVTAATGAVVGLSWFALVALPRWERVLTDLRIWPDLATRPAPPWQRAWEYLFSSDQFLPLSLPLLLAALAGTVLAVRSWRRLERAERLLIGASLGWFGVGMAAMLVSPYRPSRYIEPLLPPLAILAGFAAADLLRRLHARGIAGAVAVGALCIALVLPGVLAYGGWVRSATSRLPALQQAVAATVPRGASVEGEYAPLLAMSAPVRILVSRPDSGVNGGDLYRTRGVRWVVTVNRAAPGLAQSHPEAWAARTSRLCTPWGWKTLCLVQLP